MNQKPAEYGPADVTCPYCGEEIHVESGPTKLCEVTHCNDRWIVVDLDAGKAGHTKKYATDGGEAEAERPGCHCSDCLKADKVYRFNCPDCPDDLDGHHIAGESRAKSINASHKHEASSVEVVWRA